MSRLSLYACLACLIAGVGLSSADTVTYAVTDTGRFGLLNLNTGSFTAMGDTATRGYSGIGNLADGTLVGGDGNNNFLDIDANTGRITIIGPTGISMTCSASLLTGEQYAVDSQNDLFQIDPDTGAATLVGPTAIPGVDLSSFANALAGDDAGNLYYIYEQAAGSGKAVPSTLFWLDPTTGLASAIGATGVTGIAGAGFANGTLYAYGVNQQIYTIDVTTGRATDTGVRYSSSIRIFGSNPGGAP